MRRIVLAVTAGLLAGVTQAEEWRPASDYLFIAENCSTADDPDRCENIKRIWQKDYDAATKGGYQGQRNVAFCLTTGCGWQEIRKNPVLGCAWRIVILESGHLDASQLDADTFNLHCGPQYLDDTGRTIAKAQARTLLQKLGVPVPLQ